MATIVPATQAPDAGAGDVPMCECKPVAYAAVVRKVRKEGANEGREFYTCALGKDVGCNYFRFKDLWDSKHLENGGGGGGSSQKRPSIEGMFAASTAAKKPRLDDDVESPAAASAAAPATADAGQKKDVHKCECGVIPPREEFQGKQPHRCHTCDYFKWCSDPDCKPTPADPNAAANAPKCHCDKPATLQIVKKDGKNKGKKFYCCFHPYRSENKCSYFKWLEDLENEKEDPFKPDRVDVIDTFAQTKFQHKLDTDGNNAKRGYRAEQLFCIAAIDQGFTCVPSSEAADIMFHVDFSVYRGEFQDDLRRVDVKCAKKTARSDADAQFDLVWVELHGVRPDDKGYLIDGWADWIAFELADDFLIVDRRKLWKWLVTHLRTLVVKDKDDTEKSAMDVFVDHPHDAVYRCYQRKGRHDKMTLVPVKDIVANSNAVVATWPKVHEAPDVIQYRNTDIFAAENPKGPVVIAHLCNDVGKWGKGFVMDVSQQYPEAAHKYKEWFAQTQARGQAQAQGQANADTENACALGNIQVVDVTPEKKDAAAKIYVVNMIGQHSIGMDEDGRPPIRYKSVEKALEKLAKFVQTTHNNCHVHMPRIGCGLAGGSWPLISPLIHSTLCDHGIPVFVHDKPL